MILAVFSELTLLEGLAGSDRKSLSHFLRNSDSEITIFFEVLGLDWRQIYDLRSPLTGVTSHS